MKDIRTLLDAERLLALRDAYDHDEMAAANVKAVATLAPQLGRWNEEIARTFYDKSGPLAPAQRERCLITLIGYTGSPMSMAIHVYWGLMEGISVDEIVQIVGLVGCYGGLPKSASGLDVAYRTLSVLDEIDGERRSSSVVTALIREFSPRLR
jgi:hypothetical protein